ncbi:MAG: hypothetical protein ABL886_05595, partial [Rhodoglobus sp.]
RRCVEAKLCSCSFQNKLQWLVRTLVVSSALLGSISKTTSIVYRDVLAAQSKSVDRSLHDVIELGLSRRRWEHRENDVIQFGLLDVTIENFLALAPQSGDEFTLLIGHFNPPRCCVEKSLGPLAWDPQNCLD